MKYAGKPPYRFGIGDNSTGQCSDCGEVFYGERAFDLHRHDADNDRICLDPTTYPAHRSGERYWLDNQGRWHFGKPQDADDYEQRRKAMGQRLRIGQDSNRGGESSASRAAQGVPDPGRHEGAA